MIVNPAGNVNITDSQLTQKCGINTPSNTQP